MSTTQKMLRIQIDTLCHTATEKIDTVVALENIARVWVEVSMHLIDQFCCGNRDM